MTTATVHSSRGPREVILVVSASNINGDQSAAMELPSSVGDCLLFACGVDVSSVATLQASVENYGVYMRLKGTSTAATDGIIGAPRWTRCGDATTDNNLAAILELQRPRLWRSEESLEFNFAEVDTNVAPTADANYWALVEYIRT